MKKNMTISAGLVGVLGGAAIRIGIITLASLTWADRNATAAPAVRLIVSNDPCTFSVCPATHPIPPLTATAGKPFPLAIIAVDAQDSLDSSYTGTIHLSSSDPHASLPKSLVLTPADGGGRLLSGTLTTLGSQTIYATDESSPPLTGSLTLTVMSSSEGIPGLSEVGALLLAACLVLTALLVIRRSS